MLHFKRLGGLPDVGVQNKQGESNGTVLRHAHPSLFIFAMPNSFCFHLIVPSSVTSTMLAAMMRLILSIKSCTSRKIKHLDTKSSQNTVMETISPHCVQPIGHTQIVTAT